MTTPAFIAWLDRKMAAHDGKLIPPADMLVAELDQRIENKARAALTKRILREAGLEDQVTAVVAATRKPTAAKLAKGIARMFQSEPAREWRDHIEVIASRALRNGGTP
jgi:hypothetical protein